jgi:hypothetical protein
MLPNPAVTPKAFSSERMISTAAKSINVIFTVTY